MNCPLTLLSLLLCCCFSILIKAQEPKKTDQSRFITICNQAAVYKTEGNFDASLKALEEAKRIGSKIYGPRDTRYLNILILMADVQIDKGDLTEGEARLEEVEREIQGIDSLGFKFQNSLFKTYSTLYWYSGNYEQSEKFYLKNKALLEQYEKNKTEDYGSLLSNMAILYWGLGDLVQMEAYLLEAQDLLAEVAGRASNPYANVINNLAIFYTSTNQYQKAEPLYEEAQEILKKLVGKEHPAYASVRNNLAILYNDLKKYRKAQSLYKEALNAIESTIGQQTADYARTLQNLASVDKQLENYELANIRYKKALNIQEALVGTDHIEYVRTLGNYSALLEVEKKYEELNSLLGKAITYWDNREKGSLDHLSVLEQLARTKVYVGALDTAMILCKEVYEWNGFDHATKLNLKDLISALPDQIFRFEGRAVTGTRLWLKICDAYYAKTKDPIWLEYQQDISVALLDYISRAKSKYSTEEDLLVLLENSTFFVERSCATALLIDDTKRVEIAFENSEENKAILLSSALKSQRAKNFGNLPDSIVQQERMLKEQRDALKKQLAVAKKEERGALSTQLNDLNNTIETFNQTLKTTYSDYYQLKYASTRVDIEQFQAHLDKDALLIEYVVGSDSVYAFGLTKNSLTLHALAVPKKELTQQIKKIRKALTNYKFIIQNENEAYLLYTQTAYWFYKELMEPILKDAKGIRQLVLIPDGELAHLPFEAFLTENAAQTNVGYQDLIYLMKTYEINYNYSASLWKENKTKRVFDNNGKMLAFAASYAPDEARILDRAPHVKKMRKILQDLPAAQAEVQNLEASFEGDFLYGKQATERNFKEKAGAYSVLHLAMHGVLNTQYPILSSMAFTEDKDSLEDNFLEAHEISSLSLQAELIVLSACETGYGKFRDGEGVLSLARSFMYSGVPSLVVSLWQVNDGSTSIIMQRFYQNLQEGMNKTSALNQAKLSYIKEATGVSTHPAFWAPFIQLGDSAPIYDSKGSLWVWIGSILAAILLVLGITYNKKKTA